MPDPTTPLHGGADTRVQALQAAWSTLLHRCAGHKSKDHDKVQRVVMVGRADLDVAVLAALALVEGQKGRG